MSLSNYVHVDDEGMRIAASNMQQAAEQMIRAASLIDETLSRFLERFAEEVSRMESAIEGVEPQ